MTAQKLTVTTLGSLIEGLHGRLIPIQSLPPILEAIDAICIQAINDENRGQFRYSPFTRATYPYPEHPIDGQNEDYLFLWFDAFWQWREMLTPADFETLNGETVVVSGVQP